MKKIILFSILMCSFGSQVFACGSRDSGQEKEYTTFLLFNFFEGDLSRNDACLMAQSMASRATDELRHGTYQNSVYTDTKVIYAHLFTGSFAKELNTIIKKHLVMKNTPKKEIKNKLKLFSKVINAGRKRGYKMWYFQNNVVMPYLFNVKRARQWAVSSERLSKKGRRVDSCGKMLCS